MRAPVSESIRRHLQERYSPDYTTAALRALESTPLPFLERLSRDRDRVHLAILLYARGEEERLREAAALASADWRDLLVATGLENDDWPEVLRRGGLDPS